MISLGSWKLTRHLSLLAVCAVMAGGCAIGTTRLKVNHEPLEAAKTPRQGVVLVKLFRDNREHTDYIGNKRNGFGMVLGHMGLAGDYDLDALLTKNFSEALVAAGYTAAIEGSKKEAGLGSPKAVLNGSIETFWLDLYMMVWHKVAVKLTLTDASGQRVLWEKTIRGEAKAMLWIGATGEFEKVIRRALTGALDQAQEEFESAEFYNAVKGK